MIRFFGFSQSLGLLHRVMLFHSILVAVLALASCVSLESEEISNFSQYRRLPNDTKPISYDLHITTHVHLADFTYTGIVIIDVEVLNDTNQIALHAGFSLQNIKVDLVDKQTASEFRNLTYERYKGNTFLVIHSESGPLQLKSSRQYLLTISFNGTHETDTGFYKSISSSATNESDTVWMASTFFEPIFARLAFPCYDEPQLKARFKVSLTHASHYTALSNMPVDGNPIKIEDHMVTTKFKESPPMSTYTVAFIVGMFDKISTDFENITSSVFSARGSTLNGEYSLDVAAKSVTALAKYLEFDYPFPKLDHVGVNELPANAMENWGLIIYEARLLLRKLGDKQKDLKGAIVVAHEIAHQWFGNLLTPKWWHNIWLSEGIATFYSFKILEMAFPNLRAYEFYHFSEERYQWTNFEDRPMNSYVERIYEVWEIFSSLFYWKGSQIMRMFEHAIGEATFKKGITKYLRRYQYSSVEEQDLYDCLQEAATEDKVPEFAERGAVAKMMSSWTNQMHYPIIKVQTGRGTNEVTITQHPVTNFTGHTDPRLWWIPITMATASSPDFNVTKPNFIFPNKRLLTFSPSDYGVEFNADNDWLILNNQFIGLYRVLYDERNYLKIIEALKKNTTVIHSYNKAQLIRDAAYLVGEKLLSHSILFQLYQYLEDESDIIVWNEFISDYRYHKRRMRESGGSYYFHYFFRQISKKILAKVGLEQKPDDTAFTQAFRKQFLNIIDIIKS